MIRTTSFVVRFVRGWGEKMTASLALMALIAVPGGVSSGLVMGTIDAITPAGLAYLTMPRSGSSSMTPIEGWRRTSRRIPWILPRLLTRPSRSPMPLSSTLMWARRVKVFSLPTAQPMAWASLSTVVWS